MAAEFSGLLCLLQTRTKDESMNWPQGNETSFFILDTFPFSPLTIFSFLWKRYHYLWTKYYDKASLERKKNSVRYTVISPRKSQNVSLRTGSLESRTPGFFYRFCYSLAQSFRQVTYSLPQCKSCCEWMKYPIVHFIETCSVSLMEGFYEKMKHYLYLCYLFMLLRSVVMD